MPDTVIDVAQRSGSSGRPRRAPRSPRPASMRPSSQRRARSCSSTGPSSLSRSVRARWWPPATRRSQPRPRRRRPWGSLTAEGTIQAGEATVAVAASAAGPAGNVGPNEIDTVLSQNADARLQGFPENGQRRVTNPEATSGGADESGTQITQADVDAAVEALTADLQSEVTTPWPTRPTRSSSNPSPADPHDPWP